MSNQRVIVAMSGGVDSSVAALLLKETGYEVIGVTMRLYNTEDQKLPAYYRGCCTLDDIEDARRVCNRLEIPHYVFDVQQEFQSFVIDYFCQEYQKGRTPHPCIACNDKIKFTFLAQRASFLDANYVATGHYARIDLQDDGYHLICGVDKTKDQSYVLYGMGQEELSHTLLPVGWHDKTKIRLMAQQANFPNADKPDSQDICFIPSGDYRKFLTERVQTKEGDLVDTLGRVLGRHKGIEFYTVGQRRGLGVASAEPLYVLAIDAHLNQVIVGHETDLYQDVVWVSEVNYTNKQVAEPTKITIKVRYKSPETPAVLYPDNDKKARLKLEVPQRAITPGQAVVFYKGDEVLGGGRIDRGARETRDELGNTNKEVSLI